ncbi:MAG: type IX secretion system sortase PorU, partial [Bacteroidales bacterium]|nr:type IX secretion system sortase PorU [Bacteroidales bacterium]
MSKYIRLCILILALHLASTSVGQDFRLNRTLSWKGIVSEVSGNNMVNRFLYFDGASVDPEFNLPLFEFETGQWQNLEFSFDSLSVIACSEEENDFILNSGFSEKEFRVNFKLAYNRKIPFGFAGFIPIRFNPDIGRYEKLQYFELNGISPAGAPTPGTGSSHREYAEHSVLQDGNWYKFRVAESGLYEITYNDLLAAGLDPSTINPQNLSIFGNGGNMLPEANSTYRKDDLQEIPIIVEGEENGLFDATDRIIFFGQSPHTWKDVLGVFLFQINYYDNYNYYFLTVSNEPGKRIIYETPPVGIPSHNIYTFNDYKVYEMDLQNLILSGKSWYGDEFGETNQRTYPFSFPAIDTSKNVTVKVGLANRTYINDFLAVNINNELFDTITLTAVDPGQTKFAQKKKKTFTYSASGPDIQVELEYLPNASSSRAWLDYVNVNVTSHLQFISGQLAFRDLSSIVEGARTNFHISNSNELIRILDVTDNNNPQFMESEFNNGITDFVVSTDSLKEFIAFDGSLYFKPEFVGEVPNQDLHGNGPVDYIIITHPLFREQAERLEYLHDSLDGFKILLVEPEQVFNEFSSGKQDPTAIRDMMKMFYDKYSDNLPRYLLLFGDGSFDPKDRIEHNTNFITTYQTDESLIASQSYVVDDYFGLLDDDEGMDAHGYLDIGIGRIPSQTIEEAKIAVDKIFSYISKGEPQFGDWRNKICIIADDEDGNLHLEQADSLIDGFGFVPENFNKLKIYLDAHVQEQTPSGDRYPDVHKKLMKQMEEGALIVNYIGHGGTGGWAHERILQQADILNWTNKYKLPVFITATCEFTRFDEPEIHSGGELVLLNPNGGGIALFTTTRLAYAQSNFRLNERLYS